MDAIFHITGGLGKHILASSVINSYKFQNPTHNIIVSSAYPLIFQHNPNINESLNINNQQFFYKNYIYNKNVLVYAQEPYKQSSHILKQKHVIDSWCNMIGINRTTNSSIHPNFREIETTKNFINSEFKKPILIFQPFGGPQNSLPYCWARDIHPKLAQKIINYFKQDYDIIHICNPNHPTLSDCYRLDKRLSSISLVSFLMFSSKRILIDSCLQHASNALALPSTVLWIVTDPNIFGYNIHNNILPNINHPTGHIDSYLFDYDISGKISECPYITPDSIFSFEEIIAQI